MFLDSLIEPNSQEPIYICLAHVFSVAATGRKSMKFDTGDSYENL